MLLHYIFTIFTLFIILSATNVCYSIRHKKTLINLITSFSFHNNLFLQNQFSCSIYHGFRIIHQIYIYIFRQNLFFLNPEQTVSTSNIQYIHSCLYITFIYKIKEKSPALTDLYLCFQIIIS